MDDIHSQRFYPEIKAYLLLGIMRTDDNDIGTGLE